MLQQCSQQNPSIEVTASKKPATKISKAVAAKEAVKTHFEADKFFSMYFKEEENEYEISKWGLLLYQQTRGGVHPAKFLKGFTGFLVCDGYDAYNAVTGTKRCGCWTHTRRRFVEALPKDRSAYSTSVAAKAVSFCDSIYHEEKKLAELTATERYEQRLVKVKPLLDAFFSWLEEQKLSGKGKLAKAVNYALNEKKYLYTFLEDGNVPIDNNRAENAIRPFAVGRKNWLFNNTERGAKCSAILYSIISTVQANGLDAEKYLTELFSKPPGTLLLPWHE